MIVAQSTFSSVLSLLVGRPELALDTETTGLRPYHGDKIFSVIAYDGEESYYFNFHRYDNLDVALQLPYSWTKDFATLLESEKTWFFHNAKFDISMLARAGLPAPRGRIHDSMCIARVLDSTLLPGQFSLDACAEKIGYRKNDVVKTFLLSAGLFTEEKAPGKKTVKKNFHYDKVPFDLIVPYGEKDALITYKLGAWQQQDLKDKMLASPPDLPSLGPVYENECELVRTVYEMEATGVKIDKDFCRRAAADAEFSQTYAAVAFQHEAKEPFKDSTVVFQRVFAHEKEQWVYGPKTETGKVNPSFDSTVLETFTSPAAKAVLRWRKAKSDANYYHGFLHEADTNGVVHASFNQHATVHGRFSSSNPNLQNLTKDDDESLVNEFVVRRAIVPRSGLVFHMLDYSQMEYRLMLDYAMRFAYDNDGVVALVRKVLDGLDVHQATADIVKITRREAKTTNFAILYGSGVRNLARGLGCSESEARATKDALFRAAPEIGAFVHRVTTAAEKRGFIVNWFGRRCDFPNANFAYRAPNYLIAGGCADVVKLAMNRVAAYLRAFKTRMVLMIHDELVFEGPPEEAATVVPHVKGIMESAYPYRFVPLICEVEHSFKSLADKESGTCKV